MFTMEHGSAAYRADFAVYGAAVTGLAGLLLVAAPRAQRVELLCLAALGLASWTAIEYALHRFILHGLAPFDRWHHEHHRRPAALICSPTIFSASLIAVLVFLPMLALLGLWPACALTFGVLTGYLLYAITHHATHHWRGDSAWLKRRKRWHAFHHHGDGKLGGYGVTSAFWDHVFRSASPPPTRRR
jgi:sterol desaturase/sphingolipid hydroxylase (fatty acid hydroxylase superfamily)